MARSGQCANHLRLRLANADAAIAYPSNAQRTNAWRIPLAVRHWFHPGQCRRQLPSARVARGHSPASAWSVPPQRATHAAYWCARAIVKDMAMSEQDGVESPLLPSVRERATSRPNANEIPRHALNLADGRRLKTGNRAIRQDRRRPIDERVQTAAAPMISKPLADVEVISISQNESGRPFRAVHADQSLTLPCVPTT